MSISKPPHNHKYVAAQYRQFMEDANGRHRKALAAHNSSAAGGSNTTNKEPLPSTIPGHPTPITPSQLLRQPEPTRV